jgi:hypothetical protein
MARPKIEEKEKEAIAAMEESIAEARKETFNTKPPETPPPEVWTKEKSLEIYLKPSRTILNKDKFNEAFRSKYEHDKEYVRFIAENVEIGGERIEIWTRPFPGMPAEFWEVPVNKPIWGPRYLAEQIKRKHYNRLKMEDKPISTEGGMTYYGSMAVESVVHRLNAHSAKPSTQFSFHNKASNF